jgi:predicted patatin/cPLA2 family phospholipase
MSDSTIQHPVIQLIKERYLSNSKPGNRKDPFKLGLAIEGGGMRGVVGAGMASALHFLGLVDVFDVVYGSSAGALAGSFFVTHKMPIGPTIYYENLNNRNFIDLTAPFKKRNIMNVDYLVYKILVSVKPLNWEGVLNSKIPLKIIASSLKSRKSVCFDQYKTRDDLFALLKASANVPFIAGPPVEFEGDLLCDAYIYEPIPFKSAIADGCTHVLSLLTNPFGTRRKVTLLDKLLILRKLHSLNSNLSSDYLNQIERYNSDLLYLYSCNTKHIDQPYIYSAFTDQSAPRVGNIDKSKERLISGAISGMRIIFNLFLKEPEVRFIEVICPYNELGLIPRIKDTQ